MSVQLSDFSLSAYSDILRGIGFVWKHIDVRGGRDVIVEKLGPIFRNHHVDEKFGLAVLHRHFDLAPNERLVEVNDITTPWDANKADNIGGKIVPTSWLFRDGKLIPYEYSFVDANSAKTDTHVQPSQFSAFLEELNSALKKLRVQRYLALTAHPASDFKGAVEFTVGRTNVSLRPDRVSVAHTLEASLYFDPKYSTGIYEEKCEFEKCDLKLTAEHLAKMEQND